MRCSVSISAAALSDDAGTSVALRYALPSVAWELLPWADEPNANADSVDVGDRCDRRARDDEVAELERDHRFGEVDQRGARPRRVGDRHVGLAASQRLDHLLHSPRIRRSATAR
jgi:hypothetical protein